MNSDHHVRFAVATAAMAVLPLLSAMALEVRWTGESGGSWSEPENWSDGCPPGMDDTAVFDPGAGETLTVAISSGTTIAGIEVRSGTVSLGASATHNTDITLSGGRVEIAAGAVLNQYRPLRSNTRFGVTLLVCGGGRFNQYDYIGQNSYGDFAALVVSNAEFYTATDYNNLRVPAVALQDGAIAKMGTASYAAFRDSPSLTMEAGTVLASSRESFGSLNGAGDLYCYGGQQVTVGFSRGPSFWGGRLLTGTVLGQSCPYPALYLGAQGSVPDEDYRFVISNPQAIGVKYADIRFTDDSDPSHTLHPLRFAPGVTNFYFTAILGKKYAPLRLEDTDGNPINLYVKAHSRAAQSSFNSDHYADLAFCGSGSYYQWLDAWTGYECLAPITNDVFKGFTGQVGITGAATGFAEAGRSLTLGDGVAAHDPDLSSVAGFSSSGLHNQILFRTAAGTTVSAPVELSESGSVKFENATTVNGRLSGTGTVRADGAVTLNDVETAGASFVHSGDSVLTTPSSADVRQLTFGTSGRTLTLRGGDYHHGFNAISDSVSVHDYRYPRGSTILFGQGVTSGALRLENSRFYAYDVKLTRLELGAGGVFDQRIGHGLATVADTTQEMLFDGGTYLLDPVNCGYCNYTVPSSTKWDFLVGANGGTVKYNHLDRWYDGQWSAVDLKAEFKDDPLADSVGEIRFRTPCNLIFHYPANVSGDLALEEGWFKFNGDAVTALANGTMFGTGDLTLSECVVDFRFADAHSIPLAATAGRKLTYEQGAVVVGRGNGQAAQTITFGNGTGAALTRGGKGAALILADNQLGTGTLDGSGAKFFANGTVALDANTGLVQDPVFGSVLRSNTGAAGQYHQGLLTYDNGLGFVEFTGYEVEDFSKGAGSVVLVTNATTLSESAAIGALALRCRNLTIAEGVTLKVGPDAVGRTAHVVFDSEHDAYWSGKNTPRIDGAGTLDFGASEGVLFAGRTDTGSTVASGVNCRLAGTGGMTFLGSALNSYNGFELRHANDYTGGTYVDMTELRVFNSNALSSGDVHLAGSRIIGGGVRFIGSLTIDNDFYISGYGPNRGRDNMMEFGALVFNGGDTVINGNVAIDDRARVSCTRRVIPGLNGWTPGSGEFRGVISGGMLDISAHDLGTNGNPRVILSGANTYTGGTFVYHHTLVLRDGGTFGTGPVMLCSPSVVSFENNSPVVVPNDFSGKGTIRLAGAGDVRFTGAFEKSEYTKLTLDLADTNPVMAGIPAFSSITNSAETGYATLTLTGDCRLPEGIGFHGSNVNLVLDGATLDLGGEALTLRRLTCRNGGRVVNGTVTESNPARGVLLLVR